MGGAILALVGFATVAKINATATYDYKRGQFLVIDGGKSPDKQFAIVSGEDKSGNFGVQLMDAKTKKLIGPLEEVATELDSAPDAYRAHWSPDSKHVGICSRADRHLSINVIYRIENRRAYLVETPELLCHAVPDFCQLQKELGGGLKLNDEKYYEVPWKVRQNESYSEIKKWLSPTRFTISEESQWQVKERDPTAPIGKYGDVDKEKSDEDQTADVYFVSFEAEGACELLPSDKSRVISTHPATKSNKE